MTSPNPTRATFVHSSMAGSFTTPCKILTYGSARCSVSYTDPISKEVVMRTMENKDLTFKKPAKVKEDKRVLVSFELDSDLYFKVLQVCVDRRESLDEFFAAAIDDLLKRYKEAKKSPAKMKALKADIKRAKNDTK